MTRGRLALVGMQGGEVDGGKEGVREGGRLN